LGVSVSTLLAHVNGLLGENTDNPAITSSVKNDYMNEAYKIWTLGTRGYPFASSATIDISADQGKVEIKTINATHDTAAYIREILSVHQTTSGGAAITGKVIERTTVAEIIRLQADVGDTFDVSAYENPSLCAIQPSGGGSTGLGRTWWRVYVYPLPDADWTFAFRCLLQPKTLSSAGTSVYRLPDYDAYMVGRLAAAMMAPLMPLRKEVVDMLWDGIPETMRKASERRMLTDKVIK